MSGYAHPEVIVTTQWVQDNLKNAQVRVLEVDYDSTTNYDQGHIPGSVLIDWRKDMNDPVRRDLIDRVGAEKVLSRLGVTNDTQIILYGDFNNWFATYAFWLFKYYGHDDMRIMNGGRKKWIEEDKPVAKDVPNYPATSYKTKSPNHALRVFMPDLKEILPRVGVDTALVDVRSPKEYSGEILAPPEYPTEHAQRGGHLPKAQNISWGQAVKDDGTFKPVEELRTIYQGKGVTADKEVITYCRIGERAAHSWFVLTYLLGYPSVRVYDASWTEWGNMLRMPIEK